MDFRAQETVLQTGRVERRELAGRDHLVAPVVLIRSMVLNGGFVPPEEIQSSSVAWNGRPVTVGHPQDADGNFAPANLPEYVESHTIGRIFNAEYVDDLPHPDGGERPGARGEAWVDEQRARAMGGEAEQIADFLAAHADENGAIATDGGDPEEHVMNVSTGYWHGIIPETGRDQDGERYEQQAVDLHPDHLAFLPNQPGKCSVADGCGVPRVQQTLAANSKHYQSDMTSGDDDPLAHAASLYAGSPNANASPRTPEFDGLEPSSRDEWSEVDLTFEAFRDAYATDNPDASTWTDLSASDRTAISARSMNGEPEANTFAEGVVLPVVHPSNDSLHEGGLLSALSRAPQTEGINSNESQSRIRSLLEEHFDHEFEDNQVDIPDGLDDQAAGLFGQMMAGFAQTLGLGNGDKNVDVPCPGGCGGSSAANQNGNQSMSDPDYDIESLAEETPFDAEELEEWDEDKLAHIANSDGADGDPGGKDDDKNPEGDGAGNTNPDPDGDGTSIADLSPEELFDQFDEHLDERLTEFERNQRSDEIEEAVNTLTEEGDLDEERVQALAENDPDFLIELADNLAEADREQSQAPFVGSGVNYAGQGMPAGEGGEDGEGEGEEGDEVDPTANMGVVTRPPDGGDD